MKAFQQSLRQCSRLTGVQSVRMVSSLIRPVRTVQLQQHKYVAPVFATQQQFAPRRWFSTVGEEYTVEVPTMGDSITEGTIVQWLKNPGDYVGEDEVYCIIETDKVSVEIRATEGGGILKKQMAGEDDSVDVGAPLVVFERAEAPEGYGKAAEPAKEEAKAPEPTPSTPEPAAPAAPTPPTPAPAAPSAPEPVAPAVDLDSRSERRVKMTRMRMRIAERLSEAQSTACLLTTFNEIDMSNLMNLRKEYKEDFEKQHGIKLGFMSAFVCAATAALKEVPAVNAVIDGNDIVYRDFVDVSIAVSSPRGLVVPVLRDTHKMGFADVERNIAELGQKARNDTITLEEMTGGTFTITNGGVFGSLMSTPMLNMPQSAILGMHGVKERPVVVNGEIVARPMMYVALTYDHRLIDGRESVTFLKSIKEKVEDPQRLLLGL